MSRSKRLRTQRGRIGPAELPQHLPRDERKSRRGREPAAARSDRLMDRTDVAEQSLLTRGESRFVEASHAYVHLDFCVPPKHDEAA